VFFVVGLGKSGTSWLMRTLDGHPEILCRGEGRFFGREWKRSPEQIQGRHLASSRSHPELGGHPASQRRSHPYSTGTGNDSTFTAPPPEDILSTDLSGNYLEVRLTATDSQGLSKTVTRKLKPKTDAVRLQTRPTGLKLEVNGKPFYAPRMFVSWKCYKLDVVAPKSQRDGEGRYRVFRSWSDREPRSHTITTPANPASYEATYERSRR
jgi:Sulfotransferase family